MCKITHEVAITWVVGDESFQKRLRGHPTPAVQRRRGPAPKRGGQAAGISSYVAFRKRLIYSVTSATAFEPSCGSTA